jgi:uncharacterized membrane protein YbhN (UPF0104 family)
VTTPAASGAERPLPRWPLVVLWVILTIVLVRALPTLPWARALQELQRVHIRWIIAAVVANLLILPLWAAEWRLLVPLAFHVTYRRMVEVVGVTAAVLNSVPFFAGEISAVALLISRAGLSRGAALSVLALDQLLVGFAKLAVIAVSALHAPLPPWLRAGILSLAAGVALLLAILVPLAHRWTDVRDRLLQRPSKAGALAARALAWGTHFDALRDPDRAWRLVALALGKKGAELLGVIAVQVAFGLEPSAANGLVVLAALSITTLLPIAPGNLGVYEATVFATYRVLGVPSEAALGIAIVQHLCFLLPALAPGYVILTLRQLPRRSSA